MMLRNLNVLEKFYISFRKQKSLLRLQNRSDFAFFCWFLLSDGLRVQ